MAEKRSAWRAGRGGMDPRRLIFVDGNGAATNMAHRRGRCPRGRRLDGPVPHGHRKSTTFLAGLAMRGFTAPYVTDGAMNGRLFRAWMDQMLAPTPAAGDVVVMDNLPAHKVAGVREATEARDTELLHLPPCSPDLNPIEQAFAKLKALLCTAAERSVEGLWSTVG